MKNQKRRNKKQYKSNAEGDLELLLKRYLRFQLRWDDFFNQRILNKIKVYCLLLRLINPIEIAISAIQREEMSLDILLVYDLDVWYFSKKRFDWWDLVWYLYSKFHPNQMIRSCQYISFIRKKRLTIFGFNSYRIDEKGNIYYRTSLYVYKNGWIVSYISNHKYFIGS